MKVKEYILTDFNPEIIEAILKNLCAEFDLFNEPFDNNLNYIQYVNKFGTNIVLDFLTNRGKYQGIFVFPLNCKKDFILKISIK